MNKWDAGRATPLPVTMPKIVSVVLESRASLVVTSVPGVVASHDELISLVRCGTPTPRELLLAEVKGVPALPLKSADFV